MAGDPLFESYRTLMHYAMRYPGSGLTVPKIMVVGVQSAGKTSLIESYTKFPVGFTAAAQTGTRCPVIYELIHSPEEAEGPSVTVCTVKTGRPEPAHARDVRRHLQEHMASIEQGRLKFSDEPVWVTIRSCDVANVILVDLPGIMSSSSVDQEKNQEAIKKINARYARDPNYEIVAVINCPNDLASMSDWDLLKDVFTKDAYNEFGPPRPRWHEEAVFVVNRFNRSAPDFKMSAANDFINGGRVRGYHFVALKPDENFDREGANFDQVCDFLRGLEQAEATWFASYKASLLRKGENVPWNEANDECLGLAKARNAITRLWLRSFVDVAPSIVGQLRKRLDDVEREIRRTMDQLSAADEGTMESLLTEYVISFIDTVRALETNDLVASSDEEWHQGRTYEGDIRFSQDASTAGCHPYNSLPYLSSALGQDQYLRRRLDMLLVGKNAYARLAKIVQFALLSGVEDKIKSKRDSEFESRLASAHLDLANIPQLLDNFTQEALRGSTKTFEWMCMVLQGMVLQNEANVHNYLLSKEKFLPLASHAIFHAKLHERYGQIIGGRLGKIRDRLADDVNLYASKITMDTSMKSLLVLLCNPMTFTLPGCDEYNNVANLGGGSRDRADPRSGAYAVNPLPASAALNPRDAKKIKALLEIRAAISKWSDGGFTLADMVEGGLQQPTQLLPSSLNIDILKGMLRELCYGSLAKLNYNVDAAIEYYLVGLFKRDERRDLECLRDVIAVLKASGELVSIEGFDRQRTLAELEAWTEEKKEIGRLIQTLSNAIFVLKSSVKKADSTSVLPRPQVDNASADANGEAPAVGGEQVNGARNGLSENNGASPPPPSDPRQAAANPPRSNARERYRQQNVAYLGQ